MWFDLYKPSKLFVTLFFINERSSYLFYLGQLMRESAIYSLIKSTDVRVSYLLFYLAIDVRVSFLLLYLGHLRESQLFITLFRSTDSRVSYFFSLFRSLMQESAFCYFI